MTSKSIYSKLTISVSLVSLINISSNTFCMKRKRIHIEKKYPKDERKIKKRKIAILLKANDEINEYTVKISKEATNKSKFLIDNIEDFDKYEDTPIPLPNVDKKTLKQFALILEQSTKSRNEKDLKQTINNQDEGLTALINTAHYLNTPFMEKILYSKFVADKLLPCSINDAHNELKSANLPQNSKFEISKEYTYKKDVIIYPIDKIMGKNDPNSSLRANLLNDSKFKEIILQKAYNPEQLNNIFINSDKTKDCSNFIEKIKIESFHKNDIARWSIK